MKSIISVVLLFFAIFCKAQSKTETVNWLNSKLALSSIYDDGFGSQVRFFKANQDGSFVVTEKFWGKKRVAVGDPDKIVTFKGFFKDLNPQSVQVTKKGNLILITAECSNSAKKIIQADDTGANVFLVTGVLFTIQFADSEPNFESRLVKAFTHLIKLCGGKAEAF